MKNDMIRMVRLSVLGSVAILPLLVLPTMVGALVDYAGFSESEAGWVAAVGGMGGALAAIVIALRIRHLDPRWLAVIGLSALAVFDGVSMFVTNLPVPVFLGFRALSGVGGAAAYAAVMATIASMPNSERGYGVFMMLQFGLSALGLYALPLVLPSIGVTGMYAGAAALAIVALSQVPAVAGRTATVSEPAIEFHMLIKPAALLAMLAIGLFEASNNMHFTFAERLGVSLALDDYRIGQILSIATVLGIPAAFAVVWLGDRLGQVRPILVSLAISVFALAWLLDTSDTAAYIIAMCALSVAWAFGMPYFQAFEARLDPGGSVVVAGGFFTSVGGAAGPALAAIYVAPDDYSDVLLVPIIIYIAVACLMILASRLASKTTGG